MGKKKGGRSPIPSLNGKGSPMTKAPAIAPMGMGKKGGGSMNKTMRGGKKRSQSDNDGDEY